MLALLFDQPGEIQRFCAKPWPFQQTFRSPLKDLNRFVSTFLAPFSFAEGVLSTDEVVFEPENLLRLLFSNSLSVENQYQLTIRAAGQHAIADLLEATLADRIDFVFVSSPEALAIYANHHELTTFYAPDDVTLKNVISALTKSDFKAVLDYTKQYSGEKWR